ncbi:hypothetical protein [Flavobacterium algicola]|uniref:hypothetical protein n=1 Tax=Flavobacterium algicola TaxID=556529 RepID=UPI001EFC9BFF|nr:hypothetical protein [Flavobacterium algicola]MCG9792154.1 hypothetical protein [Flavobacterium algicola]
MNKFIVIICCLFSLFSFSQVAFTSWTNSYLQVTSYNGNSSSEALTAKLAGNGNFTIPNWKLSAKINQTLVSDDGKYTLPANKISFQPSSTTGQQSPTATPSFTEIGAPLNVILQENAEAFLIPNSNSPIYNNSSQTSSYYFLQMKFNFTVIGGAYLGAFPAWTKFTVPIEFTTYNQSNGIIGKSTQTYQIQIGNITDAPPVADEMSMQINLSASKGVLEFKSIQDYSNGASVTYTDGLSVKSNTNFQIKVRSLNSNLQSATGNTIPIDVVNLTLSGGSNSNQTITPIVLSSSSQALVKTNTSILTTYKYDIKYYTTGQDQRLISAKSDDYATTLQYEITPQ